MKVVILPEAETDLYEAYLFYEKREPGVGAYFLASLASNIRSLRNTTGGHQVVKGYHRMIAARFPHAIFYKIEVDEVRIYAVVDTRRNPEWISDRLN